MPKGCATKEPGPQEIKSSRSLWVTYAILSALFWTLAVGGSLAWDMRQVAKESRLMAIREARANFNKDQAFRLWGTEHGGVYVPATEHTPPSPNLAHIPERDIITPSGRKLTLMNPAYMIRQMMEDFGGEYGVMGRITSLKPMWEGNAPDEWEAAALRSFEQGAEEAMEFTKIDGRPYLRLMRPMVTQEGCLKCHGAQGYSAGDIRGGVGVSVPLESYASIDRQEEDALMLTHGLLWTLGMAAIGFGFFHMRRNEKRRVQSEEKVRQGEKFLQTVLDGVAEPIMLIGSDYCIRLINLAAMEGHDYTTIEHPMKCYELGHGKDEPCTGDEHPCPLDQVSLTLAPVTVVHRHLSESGGERHVEIIASPLFGDDGALEGIIETSRDITARVAAERELRSSLNEKEMLIKEIHHRVKNNLLVIQSLLKLQERHVRDEADRELFAESENRVRAMGMIHERLYRAGDLSTIDLPEYLHSLAGQLFETNRPAGSRVDLSIDVDEFAMDVDTVIPCGLIVNELLSNALKHAFPGGRDGRVALSLKDNGDGTCTLTVEDNGVGLPEGLDIGNTVSLGMQIVSALSNQIGASMDISRSGGTSFRLRFGMLSSKSGNA